MDLLLPLLVLLLLVPMILSVRRQKKEMGRLVQMQDSLRVGDRVMTTSGVYGTVVGLGDTTLDLDLAPGVRTTWARMAVREVVVEEAPVKEAVGEDSATLSDTQGPRDGGVTTGNN